MEETMFEKLSSLNVNEHTENKNGLTYLSWVWAWSEIKKQYPNANYIIKKFGFNNLPYVYDENTGYMVFTEMTIDKYTYEMWLPVMDGNNKAMLNHPYTYKVKEYKDGKWTGGYVEKDVQKATMFDINKTIMRCLVKNIAMFGLGIYIYAGEDLPEGYEISKEEAEKVIVSFGKHAGKTLKEILDSDKNYLLWMLGAEQTKQSLKDAIAKLVNVPSPEEQKLKMTLMTQLNELFLKTGIDRGKVYKHYKVTSDAEMTIEQLENAIDKLQKKVVKE